MTLAEVVTSYRTCPRTPAAVLAVLIERRGRVVATEELAYAVSDYVGGDALTHDALRSAVKHARKAIKAAGAPHGLITTFYGIGYRIG